MSVALMTHKGQQWLHLGKRECTILDAMVFWAGAAAKDCPDRVQISDDGHEGLAKDIVSGGDSDRAFSVHRFDGEVPGIGWGAIDYWAVKVDQGSDWQLLFDDDRGTVMEEVRWATNELHGINAAHDLAPAATAGYPYQDVEEFWREAGVAEEFWREIGIDADPLDP